MKEMPVKENRQLLDYPFDLYQRTRDMAEVVEIIARETGRQRLRILDVGGFRSEAAERDNLLLQEFLPGHEIYALDLAECDIPGYIQGDGTQLPFKDQVFDVVVSSDVYEHIPGPKRGEFTRELLRVTTLGGFAALGAPFYSEKTVLAEKILFEFIHKTLHVGQIQLKEHMENGLPSIEGLEQMLQENDLAFTCFDSGRLDGWLMRLMVEHYLMTTPDSQRLRTMLNRYYNMTLYESDHGGEGYRKLFVIAKEKGAAAVLEKIGRHFSDYVEKNKEQGPVSGDLDQVRLLLDLEELSTRRLFQEKDRIIEQQAAQIEVFNRMRTTRVYRFIQFFNKLFFMPFVGISRFFLGKLQQIALVCKGARKHPLLSISSRIYRRWVKKNSPTETELEELRQRGREFIYKPLVSIVVPVFNTDRQWLEKAVASVRDQVYENWELCFVNDGSTEPEVKETLDNCQKQDKRIRVKHLRRNRGIAGASNEALAMATGEFIAFMDSDDALHPLALYEVVKRLNVDQETDVIYTDEDKLTLEGRRKKPVFKSDWDPDLFMTFNYINHLTVCRKRLVDEVGGFRPEFNWSQDYDLYLRITEKTTAIVHIPQILYHWRTIPESSASKVDIRVEALEKSRQLLTETLRRRGIEAVVGEGLRPGTFKIKKMRR